MKKICQNPVLVPVMVLILLLSVNISYSFAENAKNYYFGIHAGAVLLNDGDIDFPREAISVNTSYDTGYLIGLTFGGKIDPIRLEGEITYRNNHYNKISGLGMSSYSVGGDISNTAFMFNGYYDFKISSIITPYLGAGVGFSQVSINDLTANGVWLADEDDIVLAYQLAAGIAFNLNPKTTLDIGYKYFVTSEAQFPGEWESEYSSHNITIGIKYNF